MPFVVAAVGAVVGAIGSAVGAVAGFLGIGSGLLGSVLLSGALSIGRSLLGGHSSEPSKANLDRLRASIDPRTPRKTAVGITAFNTDIRDEEFTDDQKNLERFIVAASHEVHSFDEIWFDDKLAWTSGGGVTSDYYTDGNPDLYVAVRTAGSAANAINISSRMGSSRIYEGLAYVHLRYRLWDENAKFAQSVPTRITIRGKGALFYDPRLDDTVTGGSGDHRADDQTTWEWDDDACRNPALALLFYLLGWRIQNPDTSEWLLAVGKGIPPERIDLESFAVAANLCDELVDDGDSGTEPRYRCDGTWSEGDSPTTVIDMLKATMNADLDDVDGMLRLTVFHDDLSTPDAEFGIADILDDFEWEADVPLAESFNVVRGVYTDASDKSLYQPVDYSQVDSTSADGIDRILTLNLPMVQSVTQAQRLASLRLARQIYGGGTFKAVFQATAWRVQKNSVVTLTFPPLGFVDKLFRVAEIEHRVDGTVPLVLAEESASIYDPPDLFPAIDPADTTPKDYSLTAWYTSLPAEPGATRNVVRGDWASGTDYVVGDIVYADGSSYSAILAHTSSGANEPPNGTYWQVLAAEGPSGSDGIDGLNNAIVYLYKRAATTPSAPSGTFTYTFATVALSGGTLNGWTQAIPAADGNPLWVIAATASANTATDSVAAAAFTSPVIDSGAGLNTATVYLYRRTSSSSAPTLPSTTSTYTFATGVLTGHNNSWTQTVPDLADGAYLWVTTATALSADSTDTIADTEWATPNQIGDGAATEAANNGLDSDGTVKANKVETVSIIANAVTNLNYAYTPGSATFSASTWTAVQTVSFTATGEAVSIKGGCMVVIDSSAAQSCLLRIRRGSTDLTGSFILPGSTSYDPISGNTTYHVLFSGTFSIGDVPAAGSVTYTLEINSSSASTSADCSNRYLEALEVKR